MVQAYLLELSLIVRIDKVPHLQSGVLKTDNPLELCEFCNPFFKRGQPQLLSRVNRKNNRPGTMPALPVTPTSGNTRATARQALSEFMSPGGQYHPMHLITDGTTEGELLPLVGTSEGQMIDLSAITSGIAAIRQTQASIGADLKALQTSNEHLWREALEGRDRNEKHQETIDLIVLLLERLFGAEGEGLKGVSDALRRGALGRTREDSGSDDVGSNKRRRLGVDRMIGDGRPDTQDDEDGRIVELSSGESVRLSECMFDPPQEPGYKEPFPFPIPQTSRAKPRQSAPSAPSPSSSEPWTSSSQRFTTLPTEDETSPFDPNPSGFPATGFTPGHQNLPSPQPTHNPLQPYNGNVIAPYHYTNPPPSNSGTQIPPLSPNSTAAAAASFNLDPALLQTTIGSLLQSPAAAQMFLNSLANSAQAQALQQTNNPSSSKQPNVQQPQQHPPAGTSDDDPTLSLFSPFPNQAALMNNSDALLRSYQDAAGVGGDVDKLQENIDSLVRSMGLDVPATTQDGMNGLGEGEFNVDDFLDQLSKTTENGLGGDGMGGGS